MSRNLKRILVIGAVALGLGGCVAYPAGPYYGGYGYAPYYAAPVAGTVVVGGGGGWHDGGGGWHGHWR